jgi:hypothetical protein
VALSLLNRVQCMSVDVTLKDDVNLNFLFYGPQIIIFFFHLCFRLLSYTYLNFFFLK